MAAGIVTLLGATQGIETELIVRVGGAAAAFATLGLLLVLPLYFSQRQEIRRLLRWQELEPHRGESEAERLAQAAAGATAITRPGELSPAERVTGERPALERITTERPALEEPSFWKRLIARGPRHPLVLSALAIGLAIAAVVVVSMTGQLDDSSSEGGGGKLDRAGLELVVLNASSKPSLADKVADGLTAAGFEQVRTGVTGTSKQTVVLFEKGNKRAAEVLKRELGANVVQPLDRTTKAAAPGAQVVVVAGEDYSKS